MKILVIGGAANIDYHMIKMLVDTGHELFTLNRLVARYRGSILGQHGWKRGLARQFLCRAALADHQI